jgi:sporulation protein YlmC with PRC-barrel domain
MLRSVKQLYGDRLGASDGEIGQVRDFYFDDATWALRYLVADTGTWLPGRQVLISPHSIGRLDPTGKIVHVSLTRKQIEQSPSIELHKPVSRQYEEEYYRHYGLPYYWQGDSLWGMSSAPVLRAPVTPNPSDPSHAGVAHRQGAEAHLRSAQAVNGYQLMTASGVSGQVSDFMMDPHHWAIVNLVVKIGSRFSGKEVELPVAQVQKISYQESTVFVSLTQAEVEGSPEHLLGSNAAAD